MKCVVCSKNFNGEVCPRCEYPVIHTPNYDEYITKFKDSIDNFRKDFLNSVKGSVVIHFWQDKGGVIVSSKKSLIDFTNIGDNINKTIWSDMDLARIPEADNIDIEIEVDLNGEKTNKIVKVPNIKEPGLQRIGIQIVDSNSFIVMLCNDNNKQTKSQAVSFFN